MKPSHHFIASLGFSAITYAVTRSSALAAANFIAGIFLDLDHIPEYLLKNRGRVSINAFFTEQMHVTSRKSVILLHGFDLITLGFGAVYLSGARSLAWALYLGAFQHLILDFIYNPINSPWSYFLSYRIFHGFDTDKTFHRVDTKRMWEEKRKRFFSG